MYEVSFVTTRVALVKASDPESAKRRFAAYILYDRFDGIESDVQLSFGDDTELMPALGPAPTTGSRAELRDWLALREERSEPFEANTYEDPADTLDSYLRLLATNDPWRLEGHGSLGRTLSDVPVFGELTTFDRRIRYRFEATRYLDYVKLDGITSLDRLRPQDSFGLSGLIDVCALGDESLRQIASSYTTIAREYGLTDRYALEPRDENPFVVQFEERSWERYVAHRLADPERFVPPLGWVSAFSTYDAGP